MNWIKSIFIKKEMPIKQEITNLIELSIGDTLYFSEDFPLNHAEVIETRNYSIAAQKFFCWLLKTNYGDGVYLIYAPYEKNKNLFLAKSISEIQMELYFSSDALIELFQTKTKQTIQATKIDPDALFWINPEPYALTLDKAQGYFTRIEKNMPIPSEIFPGIRQHFEYYRLTTTDSNFSIDIELYETQKGSDFLMRAMRLIARENIIKILPAKKESELTRTEQLKQKL